MITKKAVDTKNAPEAIGPYSQALVAGDFVFLSGQLGMDPSTQDFVGEDVLSQAKQIFANMKALLEAAGSDLNHVVKVEVFLTDMNYFPAISDLYGEVFSSYPPPVRQTIEVGSLPKWAKIMMSCTAVVKDAGADQVFDRNHSGQKIAGEQY